jgi:hypothetical protein
MLCEQKRTPLLLLAKVAASKSGNHLTDFLFLFVKKKGELVSIRALALFLALILPLFACSSRPQINSPTPKKASRIQKDCRKIFPQGRWRFVHSIQVDLAGKKKTELIGITQISSRSRRLHCVLMTIEGLVVFEAKRVQGNTVIKQATPPFDTAQFAKGLMQDVRLIFFPPQGECIKAGLTSNKKKICRYKSDSSSTRDILMEKENRGWSVTHYKDGNLVRSLRAFPGDSAAEPLSPSYAQEIRLEANTPSWDYSLQMSLIKAKNLNKPKD